MDRNDKLVMLKSMGFPMKERFERVVVTPKEAELVLERLSNNVRQLNLKRAEQYAKEMLAGKWTAEESADFIKFNEDLDLVDGQHRLKAIVIANIPIVLMVAWGCSHVENMDIGSKRSEMIFYKKDSEWIDTNIKAIAKQKLTLDKGIMAYGQADANIGLSRSLIKDEITANRALYEKAKAMAICARNAVRPYYRMSIGLIGGIYAHLLGKGVEKEKADAFIKRIINWRNDDKVEKALKKIKNNTKDDVKAWIEIWAQTNGLTAARSRTLTEFVTPSRSVA